MSVAMSFPYILGTGVAAGIVSFSLSFIRDIWVEQRAKRVNAKQQAFELSNKLKILSLRCEDALAHHVIAQPDPEKGYVEPPIIPKYDFMQSAHELTDLHIDFVARIADLELQKVNEESYISFGFHTWMWFDDVGEFQVQRLEFLRDEANELAVIIREEYKLPPIGNLDRLIKNDAKPSSDNIAIKDLV